MSSRTAQSDRITRTGRRGTPSRRAVSTAIRRIHQGIEPLEARTLLAAAGPYVVGANPADIVNIRSQPLTTLTINFNEAVNASSFAAEDVKIVGPDGPITLASIDTFDDQEFTIEIPAQTRRGIYSVTVGPQITDLGGNAMDQNQNGTAGEGKGQPTELGARVPCIIRGPGVKRGLVSRAVADLTDIMPTLADFSGAALPKGKTFDGHSLAPVLRGEQPQHREWIYSHLDDGRVLRNSRWLLEIAMGGKGEQFFDCGESRDGTGYKDVTGSTDADVKAARARFARILASMPEPKPRPEAERRAVKKQRKKQR